MSWAEVESSIGTLALVDLLQRPARSPDGKL
jgi:hypothetical protein